MAVAARFFCKVRPTSSGTLGSAITSFGRSRTMSIRRAWRATARDRAPVCSEAFEQRIVSGSRVQPPGLEPRVQELVLALAAEGRRAEALRAFQRAREALGDVGVEPGPALVAAEHAVLDPPAVASTATSTCYFSMVGSSRSASCPRPRRWPSSSHGWPTARAPFHCCQRPPLAGPPVRPVRIGVRQDHPHDRSAPGRGRCCADGGPQRWSRRGPTAVDRASRAARRQSEPGKKSSIGCTSMPTSDISCAPPGLRVADARQRRPPLLAGRR